MKCPLLPTESTTTIAASNPCAVGNSEMKSTETVCHCSSGIGNGWSSPIGGLRWIFVRRQRSQALQYWPMYRDIWGHQYDLDTNSSVFHRPACPATLVSWCCSTICLRNSRSWGTYIRSQKYKIPSFSF